MYLYFSMHGTRHVDGLPAISRREYCILVTVLARMPSPRIQSGTGSPAKTREVLLREVVQIITTLCSIPGLE